jgi:hypothetical protein
MAASGSYLIFSSGNCLGKEPGEGCRNQCYGISLLNVSTQNLVFQSRAVKLQRTMTFV